MSSASSRSSSPRDGDLVASSPADALFLSSSSAQYKILGLVGADTTGQISTANTIRGWLMRVQESSTNPSSESISDLRFLAQIIPDHTTAPAEVRAVVVLVSQFTSPGAQYNQELSGLAGRAIRALDAAQTPQ